MDILEHINQHDIILASKSPRRKYLLEMLDIKFRVLVKQTPEDFPAHLQSEEIALYLCEQKANIYGAEVFGPDTILITADTIVCLEGTLMDKPSGYGEAFNILRALSGKKHRVITGVCIKSKEKQYSFFSGTDVFFKKLRDEEIDYYIKVYKPYDKAGAYGIQEWIGCVGIERIEGSYFNVMGLPVQELYRVLGSFISS